MADTNILSDFGINILEEEIDDVIFQTNEFLCDATFTGSQGPFWWILQMCMALAALFSIIVAAGMAYKMMVKHEPLDIMKLFKPLVVSIILCWWYPPADTGMTNSIRMTSMRQNQLRLKISLPKSRNSSIQETPCTQLYKHRLM